MPFPPLFFYSIAYLRGYFKKTVAKFMEIGYNSFIIHYAAVFRKKYEKDGKY